MSETRTSSRWARIGVLAGAPLLLFTGVAVGSTLFPVSVPLIPAVGGDVAVQCDTDGASVSFTYGNSRAKGLRISEAKVSGIAAACNLARLEFYNSTGTLVTSASATPVSGVATIAPTIWTDEFSDVRVVLLP